MKFADPKNDVAFRKIFGNEAKKVILISFLNSVLNLEGERKIIDLEFRNTFQLPKIVGLKSSVIDVKVKDQTGTTYIVEMQLSEVSGFDKRVQYYVSKEYASQIEKGDEYSKLTPVVFIGILEFEYFEGNNYLTRHLILNKETLKNELKDINFNFIELPKFKKELKECKTLTDKWIYFIKNAESLEVIPPDVTDEGLKEAYSESDKHNWTKDELDSYDYFLMREQDEKGKMELAEKRAEKKAEKRKAFEIAKNGLNEKLPIEIISKLTGLSIAEIKSLQ
ncbi:MAG TPA: Rpn family recombination-promoting nuclease/putative transposase [Leptospiraceae bacterium]|nr:Rpn family recombination-promoting nuclease/putative transposase [Leptospiraceae bacterium]HMY34443.1 Rpn family recombination-promoting nuclease/putative transposase [Leptospiraceae bacterium]HNA07565.1 Rpn family recombination-promoting nuclease/putative transposase [Leptospiraceae bacterium]HNC59732.1 Rpn family recombination-promoting nuclease/putative transposase [Leptospiraceae bacterium]HNH58332.1 Rpn family recombination-promoting nuclease/putative transposase [Leptospiraceae bacteri